MPIDYSLFYLAIKDLRVKFLQTQPNLDYQWFEFYNWSITKLYRFLVNGSYNPTWTLEEPTLIEQTEIYIHDEGILYSITLTEIALSFLSACSAMELRLIDVPIKFMTEFQNVLFPKLSCPTCGTLYHSNLKLA